MCVCTNADAERRRRGGGVGGGGEGEARQKCLPEGPFHWFCGGSGTLFHTFIKTMFAHVSVITIINHNKNLTKTRTHYLKSMCSKSTPQGISEKDFCMWMKKWAWAHTHTHTHTKRPNYFFFFFLHLQQLTNPHTHQSLTSESPLLPQAE